MLLAYENGILTTLQVIVRVEGIALLLGNCLIVLLDTSPHLLREQTEEEGYDRHRDDGPGENQRYNTGNFNKRKGTMIFCASIEPENGYVYDDDCTNSHY